MNQSMPIRRLAEEMMAKGPLTLRLDLRHCTYIDSTFLGTVLYLRRTMLNRSRGEVVLVSPSPQCCLLLRQMGVDECLPTVVSEELEPSAWAEVSCEREDVDFFNRNVIQAHEELANLEGDPGKAFQPVASCLSKDYHAMGDA
jgi:anti-anti-sigma factor